MKLDYADIDYEQIYKWHTVDCTGWCFQHFQLLCSYMYIYITNMFVKLLSQVFIR